MAVIERLPRSTSAGARRKGKEEEESPKNEEEEERNWKEEEEVRWKRVVVEKLRLPRMLWEENPHPVARVAVRRMDDSIGTFEDDNRRARDNRGHPVVRMDGRLVDGRPVEEAD